MNDLVVHYKILDFFVCKKDYLKKKNHIQSYCLKDYLRINYQFINHHAGLSRRIVRKKSE